METRNIDAARGVIYVRHGKRGKDRLVMLNARLHAMLRAYWAHDHPSCAVAVRVAEDRAAPERGRSAQGAQARGGARGA